MYLICTRIYGVLECKTEKRKSQCKHGEPRANKFCTCHSGVAGCKSQHQCHFWRMNSMFEANTNTNSLFTQDYNVTSMRFIILHTYFAFSILHGQVSLVAVKQMNVIHEAMNGCESLKIL